MLKLLHNLAIAMQFKDIAAPEEVSGDLVPLIKGCAGYLKSNDALALRTLQAKV